MLFGNRVILKLTALKFGQPIRTAEEVHKLHELPRTRARDTPTMGGVLIIASIMGGVLLWAIPANPFIIALTIVLLGLGLLGFLDDYRKVKKRNTAGVSARGKLLLQLLVTGGAATFLLLHDAETRAYLEPIYVPFLKNPMIGLDPSQAALAFAPQVMFAVAICFFLLVMVGGSNAVNLTDGLDGLAIGCMMIASMSYAIFAYVTGNARIRRVSLSAASFASQRGDGLLHGHGRCRGGLPLVQLSPGPGLHGRYRISFARGLARDDGDLQPSGAFAGGHRRRLCHGSDDVILQVGSFKMTGKRIFRMAPIHHHFELMGWKETKVITRFWILAIMFALAGLATLKIR